MVSLDFYFKRMSLLDPFLFISKMNFFCKETTPCAMDTEESKEYKRTKLCAKIQWLYEFWKGNGMS